MAVLFAKLCNYRFVDAARLVVIKSNGKVASEETRANFAKLDTRESMVMPGFYGIIINKQSRTKIKTFTRGGSDYSGAIAAVALNGIYENYTDTHGVQTANPTIVSDTKGIAKIDYSTLHKLSIGGASVIFPDCLPILKKANVPLKIDNTFNPHKKFTLVTSRQSSDPFFSITYETRQNINKETVEIFAVLGRIHFCLNDLRSVLKGKNVYLQSFKVLPKQTEFRITATLKNYQSVIRLLHGKLIRLTH